MNVRNNATKNIIIIDAVDATANVIDKALRLATKVPTLPIIMFLPYNFMTFLKHTNGFTLNTESKTVKVSKIAAAAPNAIHKPVIIPVKIP